MIEASLEAERLFNQEIAYHTSLIPKKVQKMPWNFKGPRMGVVILTSGEVIKKLQSLGVKVSTDRSIRQWVELGLGPPPIQAAKGPGTHTEHDNKAYSEFYASLKCGKWKRVKPVRAAHIRKLALKFMNKPALYMKANEEHGMDENTLAFDIYRWVLAREKALQNIADGKVFEVIILLDEDRKPVKTIVKDQQDEDTVDFGAFQSLLSEPGVKNVGIITVVWPNEEDKNKVEVKRGCAVIY